MNKPTLLPMIRRSLLCLLCLFALGAQGQNLTVNFTFTDNSTYTVNTAPALADAFAELATASKTVADVKELEVTAGTVVAQFWEDLRGEKSNLTALTKLTITDGVDAVANIPYSSNANGMLFSVTLQEIRIAKVKVLDNHSFNKLTNLKTVWLPDVLEVKAQVFRETAIEYISLPKALSIGNLAFYGCKSLIDADFPEVRFVDSVCFSGCSKLANVNLPKVDTVRGAAFYNCKSLINIELPEVKRIGQRVFEGCAELNTVKLPKATSIGDKILYSLSKLKYVELDSLKTSNETQIIYNCNSVEHIEFPALTDIFKYFITNCKGLKSVSIPKIESIDNIPFYNCDLLNEIKMGSKPPVVKHPNLAFSHQPSIRTVILVAPDGTPLTGSEYTTAKVAYLAVNDGDPNDDLWYGWSIAAASQSITIGTLQNGTITPTKSVAMPGEEVTLTITPVATTYRLKAGSLKVHKTGDETVTVAVTAENKFTMPDYDVTVTAEFELIPTYTIAATANPTEGGTVSGAADYLEGADVTLTATPTEGYHFVNWTEGGNVVSTNASYTFTADQARTLVAQFELNSYTITATANPTEGGTVTGDGSYKHGETVSLTASPNSGYTFAGWYNGLTFLDNNSPYSFAATEAANIIAKFDTIKVTNITLDKTGTLLRKVGDTPVQITATIEPADALDKTITWTSSNELVATVADGLVQFVGVGYTTITATAASGVSASCIVNVNPAKYSITVDPNITNGEIMNSPSEAAAGDQVDLFVTPESGYQLVAGSLKVNGDASIVEPNGINQYKFSMPAEDVEVTAQFELIPTTTYAISIATDIENGTVVANPTKAAEGTPVTLTVTPDPNYQLVAGSLKYNGNDVTENAGVYTFTMPAEPVEITAQFEQMGYVINVTANPAEGGTVSGAGVYADGETVTLNATPNYGYNFVNWTEGGNVISTDKEYSFTADKNHDIEAVFAAIELNSISLNPASLTIPSTSILHYDFRVVFDPDDALNREFDWEISDQNVILNVSPYHSLISIAANNPGTATITVTSRANPNLVATCEVTVVDGDLPVQGVSLNQSSLSLIEGRAFQFKATTDPVAASNQRMTWTCTDESVVTIIPSYYYCVVVAKSAGTATVTVKTEDGGFEASCDITVIGKSITLNNSSVTLNIAESHQLEATVLPAELDQNVIWTSNNEAVATVTNGMIAAVAKGTAIIIASGAEGLEAYCVVNVNDYTETDDAIATFDDLMLAKADTFWNGTSNPDDLFTSFVSGTYRFVNTSGWGGTYWAGFAYTNTTATDAASWNTTNVGTGIDGSQNYGVAYYSSWDFPTGITVERTNTSDAKPVSGMYVTNTAQVIDVLNNGNAFARKFEQGDWFKLTATADNGNSLDFYLADFRSSDATGHYIVDSWEWFDLSPLGDVKTVSFTMSSSDVGAYGVNTPTYFAFDDFGGVAPTFTLTYSAGPNGSLNGELTQTVTYGHSGTAVEALAANSYQFLRWSDGRIDNPRTDSNVQADLSVEAEFIDANISIYTLTYAAAEGGSIRGVSTQNVVDGESGIEVEAVANEGYRFVKWSDDVTTAKRTDSNVQGDITVTAEFAIITYTLTYTAGEGGRIEGTVLQSVLHGLCGTEVEAVPSEGYRFVQWSDGVTTAKRLDENITADLSVQAEFEVVAPIFTVSLSVNDAAAGAVSGATEYEENTEATIEATAKEGYRFVRWSNGETANPYSFTVTGDVALVAEFIKQVRIDYIAATNGSINGAGSQTIDLGSTTTEVEAKPADGYRFVKWSDGHTEASRTDVATTDTTFVASFELIRHILTISVMDADAKPIAFAKVTIGDKEYKANEKGQVVDTLVPDHYSYKVECEGYDSKNGEVVLDKNIEEKVVLNKATNTGLFYNVIESLSVYPNPTVGAVQVEANGMVMVYNAAGQLLQRVPAQGKVLIDLTRYPAGVYIISVGKATAKVIKN